MDERPGRGTRRLSIRTVVVPALIVALVASIGGSSLASKRRTRTATRTYLVPRASASVMEDVLIDRRACAGATKVGCVRFGTRPRDSHVRVAVREASNTGPVFAVMAQDLDGDGFFEPWEPGLGFCGASTRVEIPEPGSDLHVLVYEAREIGVLWWGYFVRVPIPHADRCRDGGIATTGTVTATFSR